MFSQTVEYALRTAVYLASKTGMPQTNERISAVTKVPAAYLSKVLQNLNRAGIVQAQAASTAAFPWPASPPGSRFWKSSMPSNRSSESEFARWD